MIERRVTIVNKLGLHARAATRLAQLARGFEATLTLHLDEQEARADSVLGLLLLQSCQGKEVVIRATGPQAEPALAAVCQLIESRFDEAE
ncbi:HPr family phosphocarrier protein [Ferrimonas balearica]|uniref:HPr family phosphocarrier protein n=1 Tax=Ferrimonas balearica TaxID=44012 RepID=UPI001C9935F1|nr:HPr family phosphocarrier protein [Ferrimonas balearica]MBY5993106.1 HPr family phosphocarrier protein [Ferrimonas balearica]